MLDENHGSSIGSDQSTTLFSACCSGTDGTLNQSGSDGPLTSHPTLPSGQGQGVIGKVSGRRLLRLLEKQQKRCAMTGVELEPATISLDHIVPLDKGGADDMSNVQFVHVVVNAMKGTMDAEEFRRWCGLVWNHT